MDSSGGRVLYAVGALLGIVSLWYFGAELLVGLAPEIKALLLSLLFVLFLGLAGYVTQLRGVLYVLAAGTYVVLLFFLLRAFTPAAVQVFLLLALSAVLFVGLGYLDTQNRLAVDRRAVLVLSVVVVLIGGVAVAADAAGPQPTQELTVVERLQVPSAAGTVTVGALAVSNDHYLSRRVNLTQRTACVYDGERKHELDVQYSEDNRWIWGGDFVLGPGQQRTFSLTIDGYLFDAGPNGSFATVESIPVSVAPDCPATAEEPQIVIRPGQPEYW